ncbi:MAG: amidohydrolase [bacterium]
MKKLFMTVMLGALVLADSSVLSRKPEQADLVIHNANVITVDRENPRARAVAVAGERLMYVGEDEKAMSMAAPDARIINLHGKTLIPGFNDNHVHTLGAGAFYLQPILWKMSCQEIADVVAKEAEDAESGELIIGNSWDYPSCPEPHKSILDKAAPENPVILVQYSGHAAWANSRMLEKMGIDKDTSDPEGGQIVKDENGEPTGILRDTAMGNVQYREFLKQILDPKEHRRVLDKALELYRKAGITSVQDNTWEPLTARLLTKYRKKGKLTCRFTCWPYGQVKGVAYLMKLVPFDDTWVREGPWKYFADGAFSTRTAWLSEPYADEPGNTGSPRMAPEEIRKIVMKAARNRRQITFHAIGDRAIHEVLNAVEKAQQKYPWTRDLRLRMEHLQLMKDGDIQRMKELGMVAAVQPFSLSAPQKDLTLLGPERAARAYPFKSLYQAGVPVSFGSDVPAEVDYQPLLCIYYAVTRKNKAGDTGPLNPDECFTPYEALYAYTMGSAYAEFMEDEKGSITEGKLADMTVLSEDLTAVPHETIKDIRVDMTITGGKVVYENPKMKI